MSSELTIKVRVAAASYEAEDIRCLELVSLDGSLLPAFSAGSHIDVHLSEKIIRQYSLCNAPSERTQYVIAVLHDPQGRGGSAAVHELKIGDEILISTPRNLFELRPEGNSLLVAGGIGITPILSMAQSLAAAGRPFSMHYATRTRKRTAFLEKIRTSALAPSVSHYWSQEQDGQKLELDHLLRAPKSDDHLYVCGPRHFMDAVIKTATERVIPPNSIAPRSRAMRPWPAAVSG